MHDDLGDRMKSYYEDRYRIMLPRRTNVIIRIDGKAFHTFTRDCDKPFDTHINYRNMLTKLCTIEESSENESIGSV